MTPSKFYNFGEKLNKIRTRILSNDISFGVAAEFYSCDPGTKANNGNFGWVDRGDFVPEFDAIAFSVPIGEVSHVFESPFGYHIVKIEKRRGEQYYGSHILLCTEISESELVNVKFSSAVKVPLPVKLSDPAKTVIDPPPELAPPIKVPPLLGALLGPIAVIVPEPLMSPVT